MVVARRGARNLAGSFGIGFAIGVKRELALPGPIWNQHHVGSGNDRTLIVFLASSGRPAVRFQNDFKQLRRAFHMHAVRECVRVSHTNGADI